MRARLIMEYSKWARQKNENILTEPKEGLKIEGGGTVVPNGENPPDILKFLTCYIIGSY